MCHDASCLGAISNDASVPGKVRSGPINSCAVQRAPNSRKNIKNNGVRMGGLLKRKDKIPENENVQGSVNMWEHLVSGEKHKRVIFSLRH